MVRVPLFGSGLVCCACIVSVMQGQELLNTMTTLITQLESSDFPAESFAPTGLWEDLFGESGMDMKIGAYGIEATRTVPALGRLYGSEADRHFAALDELIDRAERQAERKKKEQRP